MALNLPDGWNTYRFDEIARNISERIELSDAETDIYIGLADLDPRIAHIQWLASRKSAPTTPP